MILDYFYPARCAVCGTLLLFGNHGVCPACAGKLSYVGQPACMKCGKAVAGDAEYCGDCLHHERSFSGGIALLHYNEAAKRMMAGLKYRNERENADFLAGEMIKRHGRQIRRLRAEALVPVPIHKARRRERGYNQAELLAWKIGKKLGIPVINLLIRVENTAAQKKLGYEARQKNEAHAFRAVCSCRGYRRLILVDDIYTTGATAENCTKALLLAGADEVFLLNMAIGINQ